MDRDAGDEALKDEAGVCVVAIRIDLCGVHEIVVDLHGGQIRRRGGGSGLNDGDLIFQIRDLFADTLKEAADSGVKILALNCKVGEDSLDVDSPVQVRL